MRAPWPDQGPQRKYELVLFAVKGTRPTNRLAGDVISCNSDPNLGHQAQKPVELIYDLLNRSAHPGDKVLDPFCGSGPIFEAAHRMQCYVTGLEIDPQFYTIAYERISKLP